MVITIDNCLWWLILAISCAYGCRGRCHWWMMTFVMISSDSHKWLLFVVVAGADQDGGWCVFANGDHWWWLLLAIDGDHKW